MPTAHPPARPSDTPGGASARASLIPLFAVAVLFLLVIVLTVLIAGRLRQQSAVIERQSVAIDELSRRVAELETRPVR